jgi:hypothetical protein
MVPLDLIEGVAEINLEESQLGATVAREHVAQRVGNHLDPTRAAHPVIETTERVRNVLLASDTKALPDKPTNGVAAAKGPNGITTFIESDGHTTSQETLEKLRSATASHQIDHTLKSRTKGRLSAHALLQEKGLIAKEPSARARAEGAEGGPDHIQGEEGSRVVRDRSRWNPNWMQLLQAT